MNILIITDIHKSIENLISFLRSNDFDACISCGDLSENFPDDPNTLDIPTPIYSVYGNHERWDVYEKEIKNLTWMSAGKIYDICGLKVAGMGGVESNSPQYPSHYTQGEVLESKSLAKKDIDIFVTHHPPRMYADFRADIEEHCGSFDTYQILATVKPKLFISGHLHWTQMDIYGNSGQITTFVVTFGRFKYGDYGILNDRNLHIYKNNFRISDIFWSNH